MVQIIKERPQPSPIESLFAGIHRGSDKAHEFAKIGKQATLKREELQADKIKRLGALDRIKKTKFWENATEVQKASAEAEIMGDFTGKTASSLINAEREQTGNKAFNEAISNIDNQEGTSGPFEPSTSEDLKELNRPSQRKSKKDYDNEIAKWQKSLGVATSPANKAFAESKIRELQSQREFDFKTGKEQKRSEDALRAETMPIRKEIAEKARSAQQGIENKKRLIETIETGNVDDPTYAVVAQLLPFRLGERLLSPESVVYRAGIIDEYKDLRTIFQGQTRMKEIDLLEDKIASLYLTDEQKKAILSSRIDALQSDVIRGEVAAELEAEGDFGGALQFQKKVDQHSKERMEGLFNRILDQNQAIIKDAENLKNMTLDINNPEHIHIIDQILAEANGNWKEAEKIAKKKGYKF